MLAAIDVGRICVKIVGREAGKKCVVVEVIDRNFAFITGPRALNGVKRRRVNLKHIEPTGKRVKIERGAQDEELIEALDQDMQKFLQESVKTSLR